MTPEEYEAKYGVPPPTASTRQNTPMRSMTQDEYNAKFNPQKIKPFKFEVPAPEWNRANKIQEYKDEAKKYQEEADRYSFSLKNMTMKKNPFMALGTYANQVAGDLFSGARAVKNDLAQIMNINAGGVDGYVDAEKTNEETKVSLLRKIREVEDKGGDATKFKQLYNLSVDDGEKLKEKINSMTEQPSTLKTSADLVMMAVEVLSAGTYGSVKGALAGMKTGKLAGKLPTAIQAIVDTANAPAGLLTKKGLQRIAEGGMFGYAYDVASGFAGQRGPEREGSRAFIPGAVTALGIGFPGFIAGSRSLSRVATKAGREGVTSEKRLAGLDQLERDNRQVRDTFNRFRERTYRDPSDILAHSSALNDAVDKNGTIDMTSPMSELRSMIDQEDALISDYLKTEGTTIGGPNYVGALFDGLRDTELQLGDYLKLKKEIQNLADNVGQFTNINGKIDLWKVHKAKVDLGKRIGKKWNDAEKDLVNKELYHIYMKTVEKYTKGIDVKQHNKGLSDAYELMKVFQVLNGKKVEGGRLGKHVSSTIGAVIGMSTGNPLVALAGAGAGRAIRGQQLKRAMGGKIKKPFATVEPTPRKKTSTKRTKIDDIKKKTFVTKLKDKVNQERVKNRSLMRQPGATKRGFASIGGTEPKPEPERKLVVNARDLNVNEKMQIIDETKTGADALVGTVGNLSPELRTAVIKAVKSKDQATLNKLVPQIAEELRAKAVRQNQVSIRTPEQIAQDRRAKSLARATEFKQDTKTMDIGLSPVEGKKRTRWSDAHDEAMALFESGDMDGAYRKFSQIHSEVVTFLKKRVAGAPFEKDITFKDVSFGVFEGRPEVNVGMTARIKDADMDMFHQFLSDVSERDLYQKSVLTYKHQPHSPDLPYGWIDKSKGITRDPILSFFPDEPLTLAQLKLFNEALAESGMQFMSMKDNGKRIDILDLLAYDGNYEQFVTKTTALQESLDRKGLTGSSELGATETRFIGDETESQNISYGRNKRNFLKNNPTTLKGDETIDAPVLDALRYRASMSKSEFQELLNTSNISPVEKKVYEDIIKKYPETAQINPRSLYKLLEKKTLKVSPSGSMGNYVEYGWSRVFPYDKQIDISEIEFGTQKIDTDLPISLDDLETRTSGNDVLHVKSGDVAQFGHFRYAIRKERDLYLGESQNDPYQQSEKFDVVREHVNRAGNKEDRISLEGDISVWNQRIVTNRQVIETARREIAESRAGNDMNHRVVREGRQILEKLNAWVEEKGLNTNVRIDDEGHRSVGDNYVRINGIFPKEVNGVRGYGVSLEWNRPDTTTDQRPSEKIFIPSLEQQGEPIVPENGYTAWLDINETAKTGRPSLKDLIDERENSLQTATERYIRSRENTISDAEITIEKASEAIKRARQRIARMKKPKEDFRRDQFLNFKRNNLFVKRQLQEEIEFAIKEKKAERIYLPTPSTVAKIEGYFPTPTTKQKPTYSYDGPFGPGAKRILVGEEVQVNNTPHVVLRSWEDSFQALPRNAMNKIFLPEGAIKRNRFIRDAYVSKMLERIKSDLLQYTSSDRMQEFARNLTLDTKITRRELRGEIYANTRGPVDRPFRGGGDQSRGWLEFWEKDPTLREVLERYAKKWKDDEGVLNIAFASSPAHNVLYDREGNMVINYDTQKLVRHKQPQHLEPPSPDDGLSFESRFDASKDVIRENMSRGSNQDVVLHRFDDIKRVYPELEEQFGQKLTPYVDENGNTWLYFTPDMTDPRWKFIKKATF